MNDKSRSDWCRDLSLEIVGRRRGGSCFCHLKWLIPIVVSPTIYLFNTSFNCTHSV